MIKRLRNARLWFLYFLIGAALASCAGSVDPTPELAQALDAGSGPADRQETGTPALPCEASTGPFHLCDATTQCGDGVCALVTSGRSVCVLPDADTRCL